MKLLHLISFLLITICQAVSQGLEYDAIYFRRNETIVNINDSSVMVFDRRQNLLKTIDRKNDEVTESIEVKHLVAGKKNIAAHIRNRIRTKFIKFSDYPNNLLIDTLNNKVFDVSKGSYIANLEFEYKSKDFFPSKDGEFIFTLDYDLLRKREIDSVYDLKKEYYYQPFGNYDSLGIVNVVFGSKNKYCAVIKNHDAFWAPNYSYYQSKIKEIDIIQVRTQAIVHRIDSFNLKVAPVVNDEHKTVAYCKEKKVILWNWEMEEKVFEAEFPNEIKVIAIDQEFKLLAILDEKGGIDLFEIKNESLVTQLKTKDAQDVDFTSKDLFATSSQRLQIWPLSNFRNRVEPDQHGLKSTAKAAEENIAERSGEFKAIFVGVSRAKGYNDYLQFAHQDAIRLRETFIKMGAKTTNLKLFTDSTGIGKKAKRSDIIEETNKHFNNTNKEDFIVFFISSHAEKLDNELFFVVEDTNKKIRGTGLSHNEILKYFSKAPAKKKLMIIDACHAGYANLAEAFKGKNEKELAINNILGAIQNHKNGSSIFTSSSGNEKSREGKKWGGGHGVFTHFLIDGLEGKANKNKDNYITLKEISDYVKSNVKRDTKSNQNPNLLGSLDKDMPVVFIKK